MLKLSDVATDSKEQRNQMWVVWALLFLIRYINDSRCLPRDENSMETWRLKPKETNVEV